MPQLSSILLVDDDETTNFLNRVIIERAGVTDQVLVAENGARALALLDTCDQAHAPYPALVLLDMNMPVMNGLEFLEALVQRPSAPLPPPVVVIFTTAVLPRDLARVQQLPVADVLDKPLTQAKLRNLLEQHFPHFELPAA